MAGPTCDNCVYSVCDAQSWRRAMWMGEPILPRCANHPQWPGRMHEVPGVPCRNYRPRPVLPEGDAVRLIPLGDGFYAYVDAPDYEWLRCYNWRLQNGYAARREKGRVVLMHREITQAPKNMVVDHADSNKANNCRFNLRVCTHTENLRNARKHRDARSRFKGVSYDKKMGKWHARCKFKGHDCSLGYSDSEIEAARAYDRGAVKYFGEFARLNFPNEWPPERRQELYAQRDAEKMEGKKVGGKEGKPVRAAKPRAVRAKDGTKATRRKRKGRKVLQ